MIFSRFASRFAEGSATKQLMEDLGNARQNPKFRALLGGGNPAHVPELETVFRENLLEVCNKPSLFGQVIGEYDGPQGNRLFIAALARCLSEHLEQDISPENIALTNGSQSSFGVLFNSLAGEFDGGEIKKILLPFCPEYIGYQETSWQHHSLFESRKPLISQSNDGFFKYNIDFSELKLDSNKHGAVCISRPTNPSGNVVSDEELAKLSAVCEEKGVPLIIDGAYGLPFPNIVFVEAKPFWNPNTILCLSLSKLGLPATRTGIVVAPTEVIDLISGANAANCLAPSSVGAAIVQPLLQDNSLITLCNDYITSFYRQKMNDTLSVVRHYLSHFNVKIHQPEGAIFLWLWFENLPISSSELYELLKAKGVYILAGEHFFSGFDNWPHKYECIRINFASDPQEVEKGIQEIAHTLETVFSNAIK